MWVFIIKIGENDIQYLEFPPGYEIFDFSDNSNRRFVCIC